MRGIGCQRQFGFTLVELVIVLVLVAILAAVAVPNFFAMNTNATLAAMNGIGADLASASAKNYANCKGASVTACKTITSCANLTTLATDPTVATKYDITGTGNLPLGGVAGTCTLTSKSNSSLVTTFLAFASS